MTSPDHVTMKALCLAAGHQVALREVDNDVTLQEGEALIRVLRAGICNTDLEMAKGYQGHEVGTTEA